MKNKDERPVDAAELRRRAEAIERDEAVRLPEKREALLPEETRQMLHELRVHQIELAMQNEELRRAQVELEAARERYFDLYNLAPVGYCTVSEKGLILEANLTAATLLRIARGALVRQPVTRFILREDQDIYYLHRMKLLETGEPQACDLRMLRQDGTRFWAHLATTTAQDADGAPVSRVVLSDITARKRAEAYREMGRDVLQILNEPGDLQDSIQRVLAALKTRTGFDAVGIRLQDGDDYPYFAQQGFSKDFLLTENTLIERAADGGLCRDNDGNVRLECTCGLVISGKTDPAHPLFTPEGSWWTNDSFPLLDILPEKDPRHRPRNRCLHQGFASVALVPIRSKDRIVGLIQLNDRRKGRFTLDTVQILESIAARIGAALMRKQAEKELQEKAEELRRAFDQIKTLRGIVPICASCKKIRDDQGYWNQVETFVRDHTEAEFTHGICPECAQKLYPEFMPGEGGALENEGGSQ